MRSLEKKYVGKKNINLTDAEKKAIDRKYNELNKQIQNHLDSYGSFDTGAGWMEGTGEGPAGPLDDPNFSKNLKPNLSTPNVANKVKGGAEKLSPEEVIKIREKAPNVKDEWVNPETGMEEPWIPSNAIARDADIIEKPYGPTLDEEASGIVPKDISKGIDEGLSRVEKMLGESGIDDTIKKTLWFKNMRDSWEVLSEFFGGFGGRLAEIGAHGQQLNERLINQNMPLIQAGEKLMKKLSKKRGVGNINKRIVQALQDRENADSYLRSEEEKKVYKYVKQVYDNWKQERIDRGLPVIDDYFTHMEEMERRLDLRGWGDDFATPTNPSNKARKPNAKMDYSENVFNVLRRYDNLSRKDLAFGDLVDFYKENHGKIKQEYLNRSDASEGQSFLNTWMRDLLEPEPRTKGNRITNRLMSTTYRSQLWNNPKTSAQNFFQQYLARAYLSRDAVKAAKKIKGTTKKHLIAELRENETAILDELRGEGSAAKRGAIRDFLKKADTFAWSERNNWDKVGLRAIMEEAIQSDIYKNARIAGESVDDAVLAALSDKKIGAQALDRAVSLMNLVNIGANKAFKPGYWRGAKGGFLPWFLQYKRFVLGMTENFFRTFRPQNTRQMMILRRGVPEQVEIVDNIKKAEAVLHHSKILKKAMARDNAPSSYKKALDETVVEMNKNLKELRNLTKNYEKFTAMKNVKAISKVWAASAAVQYAYDSVFGALTEKETDDASVGKAILYGAPMQVSPDVSRLAAPANLPLNLNLFFGNEDKKARREVARVAPNFIPGVGVANKMIPGRPVSGLFETLMGAKTKAEKEASKNPKSKSSLPSSKLKSKYDSNKKYSKPSNKLKGKYD